MKRKEQLKLSPSYRGTPAGTFVYQIESRVCIVSSGLSYTKEINQNIFQCFHAVKNDFFAQKIFG